MGCDIHAVFQKHDGSKWVDVDSEWNQDRHYFLFGWLAGVRLRENVQPIAKPRGFPSDFEVTDERHNGEWMGEHSESWLTADEILSAPIPEDSVDCIEYFVAEVLRLRCEHKTVRLVFGFDS